MTKKAKTKLPKTVAGVKIPKTVRQGDLLEGLLNSDTGRKVLADALLAAANAAAGVLNSQRPKVKKIAQAAEDAVKDVIVVASGLIEDALPKKKAPKAKSTKKAKKAEKAATPKAAKKRASKKAPAEASTKAPAAV
ncbi:hypothetical protein [Microvirga flavescens]|uniref:hypothetical protein n=1 Tax=Microvirga flavescens TaxID=2249811 RepID=UPI001300217B|nr:hypothetical protein [Microvirga flavescens]